MLVDFKKGIIVVQWLGLLPHSKKVVWAVPGCFLPSGVRSTGRSKLPIGMHVSECVCACLSLYVSTVRNR